MPVHHGKSPTVSVITVNFNQAQTTLKLLDSLCSIPYQDFEIIVIDNGSEENPEHLLKSRYPEIIFLRSDKNLGFAGGNNLGINLSQGKYLFFINNDATVTGDTIPRLLELFTTIPRLGIVSPLICFDPSLTRSNLDIIQFAGATRINPITARNKTIGRMQKDFGQFREPAPTAYIHGAAMMIPRRIIEEVGRLEEAFFLYYEELDWCERIKNAGYKIYLEPRAKVYHEESIATGKDSPLKTYYLNRNRILFMRRHYSGLYLMAFTVFFVFISTPKNLAKYLIKGQWDHCKAFLRAIYWHFKN